MCNAEVKVAVLESWNVSNIAKNGFTGKSLSEALIFVSTNLQYDDRLLIELLVQYMKIAS